MFKWYRDAQICYSLLSDVPSNKDALALDPNHPSFLREVREEGVKDKFRKSRWFKHSWTLQQPIAPRTVVFLSKDWKGLGTKDPLADVIEAITHIDRDILTHRKVLADERALRSGCGGRLNAKRLGSRMRPTRCPGSSRSLCLRFMARVGMHSSSSRRRFYSESRTVPSLPGANARPFPAAPAPS